ncbi:RNA 2',3'-cyclic phosphodiesterase [Myxococcota bacterium]|nr:RNA 2',3'-cyclic phosphodiesterase [Myxococcota bacterium]
MMRLFVAIDVPDAVRDALAALTRPMKGAKWVPRDQLHLTLKFIGNVDDAKVPDVVAALRSVHAVPAELAVEGVGRFPPAHAAHVLWAGLRAGPELGALASKIEQSLVPLGITADARTFAPHITLARLKDAPKPDVEAFLAEHAALSSEPFTLDHFTLYRSVLSQHGATHTVVEHFPLATPET